MQEFAGDRGEGWEGYRLRLSIKEGDTQTRAQSAVFMHVCRRGQSYLKGDWCHEKRRRSGDGARPSKVLNLSTKVPFHLQPDDCGSSM